MTPTRRTAFHVVAALALLVAAWACVRPGDDGALARGDLARLRAQAAADEWLRAQARRIVMLGESASQAWLDASEGPEDAPFGRLAAQLGGAGVPSGARLCVYQEADDTTPSGLVLLGYTEASGVTRTVPPTWPGRVPAGVLLAEVARFDDAIGADDLVWFSLEDGAVRLHAMALYHHTYESQGRRRRDEVVRRAFEASVPVQAPDGVALEAACELVEGRWDVALPLHGVAGARRAAPDDVVASSAFPASHAHRSPNPDDRPRLRVFAPAPPPPSPPLRVYLGPLLGGAAALVGFVGLRRRRAAPDVAAEAAHELKTPLTAMRGGLEVALRRERCADEYRHALASTLEEVKGLQHVVGSLLLLTRGAEAPLAREPVDLVESVRVEAERLHGLAADREVSLASVRGPRLVLGDPSLLARAVANLLDNAHLHSVAGGAVRVRVEVVRREILVSVEDDGPGIPAPRRDRVFQRFWRGPDVGQRGIPGAGLGLPIARFIAKLHGGALTLDPQVEGRARFVLRLPLA